MKNGKWTIQDMPDQSGKVIIVTGANSGLGFETSKALAARSAQVVMACRNMRKGEEAAAAIRTAVPGASLDLMQLDLASLDSIEQFAQTFKTRYERLDVLVNNAGIMATPYTQTADGFEMQFGTNHLGHFALTGALLDVLLKTPGARIVNVSSGMHRFVSSMNFDDIQGRQAYNRWNAYGQSKLANLLFTYELQRKLEQADADLIAVAAHPGYAATNLQTNGRGGAGSRVWNGINKLLAQSQAMGALPQLYAATEDTVSGGEYYGPGGLFESRGYPRRVQASAAAHDAAAAARLWQISEELTGVTYGALEHKEGVQSWQK